MTEQHDSIILNFIVRVLLVPFIFVFGIYVLAGIVPLLLGANYLDYAALPVEWFNAVAGHERTNCAMGIFIIEVGIFIGVFSVLVILYDHLTERFTDD